MGTKGKVGKERRDKFYTLAKQQGFRARSAFKLTQLASKFRLFDSALHVIDLCAAPGGWMQVARNALPMAGVVVGVDLVPIRPIKNCQSIVADITTPRCDKLLRETLTQSSVIDGKVDIVLHDGAPNVGANWDRDAYVQNELVLASLQTATKFLRAGGHFVTKVFRSTDYTKLMFVFQQLFRKVQATKPSSSRNVSAEIFVVCQNFKAPAKISPDLFNLERVFEALETEPSSAKKAADSLSTKTKSLKEALVANGLKSALQQVKLKNRSGYEPGDDYRTCTLKEFLESAQPAVLLVHHHKIILPDSPSPSTPSASDTSSATTSSTTALSASSSVSQLIDSAWVSSLMKHASLTPELKGMFGDLKVLGKPDLARLLRWRASMLKERLREQAPSTSVVITKIGTHTDGMGAGAGAEASGVDGGEEEEKAVHELDGLLMDEAKIRLKKLRNLRTKQRRLAMKLKVAAAVIDVQTEDPDLFTDGIKSFDLLEKYESKILSGSDKADDAADADQKLKALTQARANGNEDSDERGDEEGSDGSTEAGEEEEGGEDDDEDDEEDDEEDHVATLEKELNEFHAKQKELDLQAGLIRAAKKDKSTRRQQVFAQWAEEAEAFAEDIETRNADILLERKRVAEDEDSEQDGEQDEAAGSDEDDEDEDEDEGDDDDEDEDENEGEDDNQENESTADVSDEEQEGKEQKEMKRMKALEKEAMKRTMFSSSVFDGLLTPSAGARSRSISSSKKPAESLSQFNDSDDESQNEDGIREMAEEDIPVLPVRDKVLRQIKRRKENERKEARETKKAKKDSELLKKLGGDVVDDDQVAKSEGLAGTGTGRSFQEVPASQPLSGTNPLSPLLTPPESKEDIVKIQALGSLMTKRQSRMELLDGMYNRWAFEDGDLPDWFKEDDQVARIPDLPLTKELMDEYRRKLKDIQERPIRKVAEAKARKRAKLSNRLESIKRQAAQVAESSEYNEQGKRQVMDKLLKKARKTGDKRQGNKKYAVARGSGGLTAVKSKGKQKTGKNVKVVDRRLKKDRRGLKAAARRKGKK